MTLVPLRSHEPHEFLIATRAVPESVIAGVSALSYWGLIDQVPLDVVTAITPRTVVPPEARGERSNSSFGPAAWVIHGLRYIYRRVSVDELIGVQDTQVDDETVVPMFDCERTLLDTFLHLRAYGAGLGAEILLEHGEDIDLAVVRDYARTLSASRALHAIDQALNGIAA